MTIVGLLSIAFILLIIYIICCPFDKAMLIIICAQFLGIMACVCGYVKHSREKFYNPSKLEEDEKFGIHIPENYEDVVQELKNIEYNVNVDNHDNADQLDTYDLDAPEISTEDMIQVILDENSTDNSVDYHVASHGAELAKRNKMALNIRSRYHKDNFKKYFEEELDESAERQWFDRDQLEYDF